MDIFVTGASGFVGGAACRQLVARGHRVRAMSRRPQSDEQIRAAGAEPVRCSLEDVGAGHLAGAGVVLHCAAYVEPWGPRDAWYRGNVLGTRSLLAAAREAGVKRFIHIGSEAALVRGQHLRDVDESYPLAPDSPYPYCATKAQAEQLVREADSPDMTTLILRPRFIWGPGDTTLLPAIADMAQRGGWVWIDHGRAETSTTHIDNLVHAIALALVAGGGGEAYFILDEGRHSFHFMVTGMAASRGLELGERSIPAWLGDFAGAACEWTWRLLRLDSAPPLTRHAAMVMSRDCTLVGAKAARELAYLPVISVEDGLAQLQARGDPS